MSSAQAAVPMGSDYSWILDAAKEKVSKMAAGNASFDKAIAAIQTLGSVSKKDLPAHILNKTDPKMVGGIVEAAMAKMAVSERDQRRANLMKTIYHAAGNVATASGAILGPEAALVGAALHLKAEITPLEMAVSAKIGEKIKEINPFRRNKTRQNKGTQPTFDKK